LNIDQHISSLSSFVRGQNFAGYDPYDALNSPILRPLTFGQKYGRIAWIQFMRRFPFNLRPLLMVAKGHNPKALGLFLGGYAKLYNSDPKPEYLTQIHVLLDLLEETRSEGYSGNCWGYNFDWQSRAFFVPKFTPTIVNSSFIGHALLDTYEYTGEQKALEMAISIKEFLLNDLHRKVEGETFCFSYTPIDHTAVHNANLLGASLLIRLHKITGEPELRDAALSSLAYSMKYQRDDGSWFYAETKMQSWIDSFHTGFNLVAVRHFLKAGEAEEFKNDYDSGVRYYAANFFLADGTPKYYHNRTYPIDIHAPAEAVVFFSGEGERYRILTDRILQWMISNMQDAKGYFYFRKGPKFTNKIPYMRWSQAWAFHALTEYALHRGIDD
jgi:rhamnogalacturonyl hydrolase YesR